MALRFLADHCISNFTIETLRSSAHDVLRLRDVLPVESTDTAVIAKVQVHPLEPAPSLDQ